MGSPQKGRAGLKLCCAARRCTALKGTSHLGRVGEGVCGGHPRPVRVERVWRWLGVDCAGPGYR